MTKCYILFNVSLKSLGQKIESVQMGKIGVVFKAILLVFKAILFLDLTMTPKICRSQS